MKESSAFSVGTSGKRIKTKRNTGVIKDVVIILIMLSVGSFSMFAIPRVIKINQVVCKDQWGTCPEKILQSLASISGKDLYQTKKEVAKLLENDFSLEASSVRFQLPGQVKLDLIVRKPVFALEEESGFALVDRKGFVVGTSGETNLPRLKYSGSKVEPGNYVDTKALFALELLLYMREIYQIYNGEIFADSIVFNTNSGIRLVFPKEGDVRLLVGASHVVIAELNKLDDESRMKLSGLQVNLCQAACTVDFRYKNPVINSIR